MTRFAYKVQRRSQWRVSDTIQFLFSFHTYTRIHAWPNGHSLCFSVVLVALFIDCRGLDPSSLSRLMTVSHIHSSICINANSIRCPPFRTKRNKNSRYTWHVPITFAYVLFFAFHEFVPWFSVHKLWPNRNQTSWAVRFIKIHWQWPQNGQLFQPPAHRHHLSKKTKLNKTLFRQTGWSWRGRWTKNEATISIVSSRAWKLMWQIRFGSTVVARISQKTSLTKQSWKHSHVRWNHFANGQSCNLWIMCSCVHIHLSLSHTHTPLSIPSQRQRPGLFTITLRVFLFVSVDVASCIRQICLCYRKCMFTAFGSPSLPRQMIWLLCISTNTHAQRHRQRQRNCVLAQNQCRRRRTINIEKSVPFWIPKSLATIVWEFKWMFSEPIQLTHTHAWTHTLRSLTHTAKRPQDTRFYIFHISLVWLKGGHIVLSIETERTNKCSRCSADWFGTACFMQSTSHHMVELKSIDDVGRKWRKRGRLRNAR